MRTIKIYLILVLAATLIAAFTISKVGTVSAQQDQPVGVVVAYVPGQSITIVDQSGNQHAYMISSSLKILPPGRANSLTIGSFVTVIAPASLSQGKETAVGIVIHPHVPAGWNVPSLSATPGVSETPGGTFTATPAGTSMPTETATPTGTGTETASETATATVTGSPLETPTATATTMSGNNPDTTNTLVGWLMSLVRQLLPSR